MNPFLIRPYWVGIPKGRVENLPYHFIQNPSFTQIRWQNAPKVIPWPWESLPGSCGEKNLSYLENRRVVVSELLHSDLFLKISLGKLLISGI